jgi:predicted metalloendopeptidase
MNHTSKNNSRNNKSKKNNSKNKTIKRGINMCTTKSFTTFEDKVEKVFKENNLDFLSTNYNLQKQILKDFKEAVSPSNIKPQDDFYSYINEKWMIEFNLEESQKYIVQVDEFRLIQDKVYKELIEIVDDYIKHNKNKLSTCLKNFYKSVQIQNTNKQSTYYANLVLNQIDDLRKDKNNIWIFLGFINTIEIISYGSPIVWSINPDDKQPDTYRSYIQSPQVTLIDLNIYFDDGTDVEYKKKYKANYMIFLRELFENVFGPNHEFNVKDVFDIEYKILLAFGCDTVKNENSDNYNVVKKEDALKKYDFDWESFATALGFNKVPDFFIAGSLNYLKCISKLLVDEWDSPQWRTYWIYLFIRQQQRFNKIGHDIYYKFHGKFVRGQEQNVNENIKPIYTLGYAFNTFLTNEYIKKYKNDLTIEYVKVMAEDLKTVFKRIVRRNKWLQPKTKEMALKKLYNFKLEIGEPDMVLREDPLLDYNDNDIWGNLIKIAKWRNEQAIHLEGHKLIDLPVIDWSVDPPKFVSTQAYVVNASYTPSKNGIYIPLGYIQKPFVDLDERGVEYNLARIGYTLAHEMSHSLDDWGSRYDDTGKLNNWWTEKDKKKFEQIQNDVIKQYETFAAYDGIKFDAKPSIGEDLADISGLAICLEYLRDFQLKNKDILPIQKLSFEAFFVYFASHQQQIISKKALDAQLKTNPHPLNKYRTNVPLSRVPVFRALFDIKKGDKMWWHSMNRVWED